MRLIITIWALAGIGIASLLLMSIESAGFPDGYISPYDRLVLLPQTVLAAILLFTGALLLIRSAINRISRFDVFLCAAMLPCLYLPMIVTESCPRWQMCTSIFESTTGMMMDDGAGG